jgi:NTP pyrophosphatase (non-canonical NTP hydrolase)
MNPIVNTLNGYQNAMMQFVRYPDGLSPDLDKSQLDIYHAAFGLASEVGEVGDALKRDLAYGKPYDKLNLLEEAGDILWYVSLLCHGAGFTLQQAAEANIAKLLKRNAVKGNVESTEGRDLEGERAAMLKAAGG